MTTSRIRGGGVGAQGPGPQLRAQNPPRSRGRQGRRPGVPGPPLAATASASSRGRLPKLAAPFGAQPVRRPAAAAVVHVPETARDDDAPDPTGRPPRPERLTSSAEVGGRLNERSSTSISRDRAIVLLREVEGLAYDEIAELLGLKMGTLKATASPGAREAAARARARGGDAMTCEEIRRHDSRGARRRARRRSPSPFARTSPRAAPAASLEGRPRVADRRSPRVAARSASRRGARRRRGARPSAPGPGPHRRRWTPGVSRRRRSSSAALSDGNAVLRVSRRRGRPEPSRRELARASAQAEMVFGYTARALAATRDATADRVLAVEGFARGAGRRRIAPAKETLMNALPRRPHAHCSCSDRWRRHRPRRNAPPPPAATSTARCSGALVDDTKRRRRGQPRRRHPAGSGEEQRATTTATGDTQETCSRSSRRSTP